MSLVYGVILVTLSGGTILYHRSYKENLGLPNKRGGFASFYVASACSAGPPYLSMFPVEQRTRKCSCGFAHVDEISLGSLFFALYSFSGG